MIIDGKNKTQASIISRKCFFKTMGQIRHDFEQKGYATPANEAMEAVKAYHQIVQKQVKNNFNEDYNRAFQHIDTAIKTVANTVFYEHEKKSVDYAYKTFKDFNYINALVERPKIKTNSNE